MEWQVKAPTWDFDVLQVGSEPSVARRAAHTGAPAPEQQHQLHNPTWGSFPADSSFNPLAGTGNGNDEQRQQQQRGSDGNVTAGDQRIVAQDVKGSFSMLGSGSGITALYAAGSSLPIVSISNVAKAQEHEAQQQQLLVPFHSAHESEPGKLRSSSWQLMFREKGEQSENDDRQLLRHVHQDGIAAGVANSFPHNIDFQQYQQQQPRSGEMPKPRPVENTIKAGSMMLSKPIADSISCDTPSNAGACKRPSRYGGGEDQNNNGSLQQPNAGNVKKCRASSTITSSPVAHHAAAAPPRCQVEGCREDLAKAKKDYHRRHKVCEMHSKAPRVIASGVEQRFCQQCSRFHLLSEFDDAKRSCRKRLAGHNERRRKSSQDASALSAASIFQDDRLRHLSYLMHPLAMALPLHYHDSCNNSSAGIASTGAHAALRRPWPMTSGWPGMEADNHFATTLCRAQALTNNGASVGGTAGAAGLLSSLCSTNSTSTSTASRLLSALQAHDNNNNNHLLPLKYHDHQMHENARLSSPCNNNSGIVNNVSMGEGLTLSSSNGSAASSNSSSSQGPNSNTSTDTNNNHSMQFMASLEAAAAHHPSGLLDSGRALSLLSSGQAALNHIPSSRPTNSLMIPSHHVAPNPNNLSMHLHNPRNDHNPVYNAHNHSFSAALADHPHFSLPRGPHHQEDHHLDLKPSALNALSSSPSANCNNAAGQQLALSIGTSANGESPTSQQNGSDAVMGAANKTLMSATNSTNLFQALAGSNPDILARLVQQTQHHQQQSSSTSSEDKLPSSLDDQRPTSMQPVELLLSNSSHHHHHLRLADTFPSLSRSAFEPSLFTAHSNL